jgi:hypothetical protein
MNLKERIESALNMIEDLEKQGKFIRYFYGEGEWVITEKGEKQPCDEAIAEVKGVS